MSGVARIADLVVRQVGETAAAAATSIAAAPEAEDVAPACEPENEYDGRIGLRVSAIFVILVGSTLGMFPALSRRTKITVLTWETGAVFPVFAGRHRGTGVPEWAFFIAKYFGSGVIIATAFIHVSPPTITLSREKQGTAFTNIIHQLLAPAQEALGNECLTGPIVQYPWVEGIALMTIFVLFFVELMAMRFATFGHSHEDPSSASKTTNNINGDDESALKAPSSSPEDPRRPSQHAPGEDHLSHTRAHIDHETHPTPTTITGAKPKWYHPITTSPSNTTNINGGVNGTGTGDVSAPTATGTTIHDVEDYAAQLTAITILEFGVIFHSIFIGLTLAVAGEEFITLYIVLVFHQTFEGLGLGSRLAATPFPSAKSAGLQRFTPYLFAIAYGLSTPIAIAIGLGVRETYAPGSRTALIVNGVFDSISAGILIYTGLVELMAHEFMFSAVMRRADIRVVGSAFGIMCLGAGEFLRSHSLSFSFLCSFHK